MAITPLMPVYPRSPVRPVRGEGVYLFGEQGERYLDFAAGIAVNILGHGHPHLTKAIQDQAATLMHVSNLYGSPQGEAFAKRLCDLTFADTVFFTNSGVEAVECAIKTARRYHYAKGNSHKHDLISFSNAFHGRTMATISATDQAKMIDGFAPLLPGFKVVEFNDLDAALAAIDENTAGFLLEPIQGEGGIRPGTHEFLSGLRAACDERCSGDGLRHRDQVRAGQRAEVIPGRAARDDQKVQTRLREREVVRKRVRRRDVRRAGDGGRNILHAAIPTTDAAFANLTRHDRSAITSAVVSTSAPQTT